MKKKMIAFHGKDSIKKKYLDRVKKHYEADEIIHGTYWKNGKGCAVGCTVEKGSNAHEAMERELGIPQTIAYLEDTIFENLKNGESKEFPKKFLEAIPVGADLSLVTARFMVWQMKGLEKNAKGFPDVLASLKQVAKLYGRIIKGEIVTDEEWHSAAESAAESAESAWSAWSAAESAAESAWSAARSAESAWSAARSAESAESAESAWSAWSAARSAESAWSAARSAAYKKMARKLLQLLKDAPVQK